MELFGQLSTDLSALRSKVINLFDTQEANLDVNNQIIAELNIRLRQIEGEFKDTKDNYERVLNLAQQVGVDLKQCASESNTRTLEMKTSMEENARVERLESECKAKLSAFDTQRNELDECDRTLEIRKRNLRLRITITEAMKKASVPAAGQARTTRPPLYKKLALSSHPDRCSRTSIQDLRSMYQDQVAAGFTDLKEVADFLGRGVEGKTLYDYRGNVIYDPQIEDSQQRMTPLCNELLSSVNDTTLEIEKLIAADKLKAS